MLGEALAKKVAVDNDDSPRCLQEPAGHELVSARGRNACCSGRATRMRLCNECSAELWSAVFWAVLLCSALRSVWWGLEQSSGPTQLLYQLHLHKDRRPVSM